VNKLKENFVIFKLEVSSKEAYARNVDNSGLPKFGTPENI